MKKFSKFKSGQLCSVICQRQLPRGKRDATIKLLFIMELFLDFQCACRSSFLSMSPTANLQDSIPMREAFSYYTTLQRIWPSSSKSIGMAEARHSVQLLCAYPGPPAIPNDVGIPGGQSLEARSIHHPFLPLPWRANNCSSKAIGPASASFGRCLRVYVPTSHPSK